MGVQNRIYVTLSPRMRRALELCATFDGSTPASYAAMLMTSALTLEIEKHPALQERWVELEREAFLGRKNVNISTVRGSWYLIQLGKFAPMALALTWVRNRAVGQTRSHSAERRPMLQCTPSLSSSVPRAFSPQPRWLFLADPPPTRRAPAG